LEVYFYGKKKDSPQKEAHREMMSSHLGENNVNVKDGIEASDSMPILA